MMLSITFRNQFSFNKNIVKNRNVFFLFTDKSLNAPGAKRGRLLIRQSRVKKEIDSLVTGNASAEEQEFDASTSHHHLSVPVHHSKFERHVSEPTPRKSASPVMGSMHLLSVPMQNPILTKQHSQPLLPSQSSSCNIQYPQHYQQHPHLPLHRQLSYPGSSEPPSTHEIQSSSIASNSSFISATPTNLSSRPSISPTTSHSIVPVSATIGLIAASQQFVTSPYKSEELDYPQRISIDKPHDLSPTNYSSISSEPLSLSVEHVPSLRVKSEELHRSISSPQVKILLFMTKKIKISLNDNPFCCNYRALAVNYRLKLDHNIVR